MSWEYVALGELYEVHNGLSKGGKLFGKGSPFLSFSTVFNKWFLPQELLDLVQSTDNEQQSYSILRGDVFITRTSETMDELGMSSVALKDYPHATYNGFTKRLRPINPERVLPEFIGYYLRTPVFRAGFTAFSTMTTRASLRNEDLLSMKVPVPDMQTQKHIASILSAYDDLVENNQKQIKLLEEAAQRLYKEWFVDLRFPGHETTPIVDGIPEGWSKEELGNIAVLRAGGDRPKVFSKVKTVECSVPVFSNGTEDEGLYGFTNLAEIYDPCVTISARGSVGYTCLRKVAFVPIVRLISVIPKQIEVEYLFYFLKNMVFESNGAAQQQITVPMIKSKQVVLPAKTVINLFISKIRPMMDLREKLKNKISALNEARNHLLSKLMSGEIEV